jgi:hypothetical protein
MTRDAHGAHDVDTTEDAEDGTSLGGTGEMEVTKKRGSEGETVIAYLPAVHESTSDRAREIRWRRLQKGSTAVRARKEALKQMGAVGGLAPR